ncbi:reverse transcriptase domain-containing protein [Tanacetum coccineum]|uniref:Reverse transcriptase domain-containing protein n=1 Tax=Tanacetum coccineum TaxID=301880 RepID=A0ABQ5E649_9ASTR
MLKTFPFSLSEEAKTRLSELDEVTITSWNELREAFISRYFSPIKFRRLLNEINNFHQLDNEILVDAWLRIKEMLRTCYGHGLTKGTIIQILYCGLDGPTQEILDARGIFLYNTPNEAFKILEDKVLLKLDFSDDSQKPKPKTIVFDGGSNIDSAGNGEGGGLEQDLEVKKHQRRSKKNLLKQQFETFTIGSREELDSAYERFQHILSMLELYNAKVSQEDANLKFLRSTSVWHVYEHELKGVSISSSQNIAFLSTEVKGSTLKQSTADPANIPKGIILRLPQADSYSKPWCNRNNEEIDWTRNLMLEPVIFAMMTLTELEDDHWSMELMQSLFEVILKTHEKNEYAWGDKYEQMEYDLKMRDFKLEEKQKELDQVLKERDDFKVNDRAGFTP